MNHWIRIDDLEQYARAIHVLDEVGGTFSGVGSAPNRMLVVTDAQYKALVEAKVISPNDRSRK
jgi:hypothetical protein